MKNFLLLFLISFTNFAFAEENYIVNKIENSCAPWDGHAIYLGFKNSTNENETINISIWRWKDWHLTNSFDFDSKNSYYGSMNICFGNGSRAHCQLQNGTLKLNQYFKSFKPGDEVHGEVIITSPSSKKFNFSYIVKPQDPKNPMICG